MTLGEILGKTFAIYRKGFWAFTGMAALLVIPIFALAALFDGRLAILEFLYVCLL